MKGRPLSSDDAGVESDSEDKTHDLADEGDGPDSIAIHLPLSSIWPFIGFTLFIVGAILLIRVLDQRPVPISTALLAALITCSSSVLVFEIVRRRFPLIVNKRGMLVQGPFRKPIFVPWDSIVRCKQSNVAFIPTLEFAAFHDKVLKGWVFAEFFNTKEFKQFMAKNQKILPGVIAESLRDNSSP